MSDSLKLYSYYRSSASYRVRLALAYKELNYDYLAVHLLNNGGEQNSPDYVAANPMRQVPTLVDGDLVLSQSLAIYEYLDEKYPNTKRLLPTDTAGRAKVREFCEIINAGIQPLQNLKTLQTLDEYFKPLAAVKMRWMHYWMARGYSALEEKLRMTSGTYSFGNTLTAADLFLYAQIFSSNRFQFSIETYPNMKRVYENIAKLEILEKAHPNQQIDAE